MGYQPDLAGRRVDRLNDKIRRSFITGIALTVPLIVTLLVIGFVLQTVTGAVRPLVQGMNFLFGAGEVPDFVLEIFTLVLLFWFFLAVGFVADRQAGSDSRLAGIFDEMMSNIPGLGSVYTGVQQMTEVVLSTDSESFRAVKLVEFPSMGVYMLCFVTATPPTSISDATGDPEMETVFVPMAPNPVMGGFLTFVPRGRVHDIDMSVEQGMRAIMTSGVAIDPRTEDGELTPEEVVREFEGGVDPDE